MIFSAKKLLFLATLSLFVVPPFAGTAQAADTDTKAVADASCPPNARPRELGIEIGILKPGKWNAITDVEGVLVGQVNVHDKAKGAYTGVTAVVPHAGNIFQEKVPCGIFLGNAFGKMTGYPQVKELGTLETPVVLTNTLNIAAGLDGIIDYTFSFKENGKVRSVNGVVGETNDSGINRIRERFVTSKDVLKAIQDAKSGPVEEGAVGAGSGTIAFGHKGGIGTSSRVLPKNLGGYTVGVLVQTNFGGILTINGVQVGTMLGGYPYQKALESADGSIMMVVATDAPVDARNLERMAKRAFMGMTRTGGIASNGSGDFAIAFSTDKRLRSKHDAPEMELETPSVIRNDDMTPLFLATIEATEEAVINSLFAAKDTESYSEEGKIIKAIPKEKVLKVLEEHKALKKPVAQ